MKIPIYMDYHATTPVDRRVLEAMLPYFSEEFGNAASKSHAFGWRAEEAVEAAREEVAKLVGASAKENRLDERRDRVRQPGGEGRGAVLPVEGQAPRHLQDRAQGRARLDARARAAGLRGDLPRRREGRPARSRAPRGGAAEGHDPRLDHAREQRDGRRPPDRGDRAGSTRAAGVLFHCDAVQGVGKVPVRRRRRRTSTSPRSRRTRCTGRRAWARSTSGASPACGSSRRWTAAGTSAASAPER